MKLKKTILSVLACALSCVMMFAATACGGDKNKDPIPTGITLDQPTIELATGDVQKLTATVTYSDDTTSNKGTDVEWSSSKESVATVTRGNVSAKAEGTTTITAKIGEYTATCSVNVYSLVVELSETTVSLEKGATKTLTATVKRSGTAVADAKIDWESDNTAVATVDATGKITAWSIGTANITAKRNGGVQSATCAVTVTWNSKPESYEAIPFGEQNKLTPNSWAYWNAQSGWGQGEATAYEAYTEDYEAGKTPAAGYEYIGVEKATFDFEVTSPMYAHTYQVFYRSSDNVEGGILHYNHDYEVKFKLDSNVAGKIGVNPYDDIRAQGAEESDEDYEAYLDGRKDEGKLSDHEFDIVAGTNEITVIFRHDDCGYVYQTTIYDNMGTALHLQLANLEGRVQLSVYDVQFKDLGEATYPVEDDESKHAGNESTVVEPTHPADPAVKPASAVTVTAVTLTVEGDKAIYNLAGTVDLAQFDNSADTAKTWLTSNRFDLQDCGGSWVSHAFERVDVTVNNDGTFLIKYDITYLTAQGYAYTSHFGEKETSEEGYNDNKYRDVKLDEEHAVPGASITVGNKVYAISNVVGGSEQSNNWGCVSIKVTAAAVAELPEDVITLTVEGDKLYYIVKGTYEGEGTLAKENIKFNLQGNPYVSTGEWGGDWTSYTFEGIELTYNEDKTYIIKIDISSLITKEFDYTSHLTVGASADMNAAAEAKDGGPADFKLTVSGEKAVTYKGYTVKLISVVGSSDGATYWGCVGLNVRNAE